jgi:excisionase family DNA binding protein
MKEAVKEKFTYDRKEAARRLGISVVTLDREVANKRMPHFRIGRRVLFTNELLEMYISQNTRMAPPKRIRKLNNA